MARLDQSFEAYGATCSPIKGRSLKLIDFYGFFEEVE